MISYIPGKSFLITGGTGSFGSALSRIPLNDKAKLVRVFSNDENGLFYLISH